MIQTLAGRFLRQPAFIKAWILPVWVLLGLSKLLILIVPFKNFAPRLGRSYGIHAWVPLLSPAQDRRALIIGRLVRGTARYTPWNSNCFPQAMTARLLLGLYRIPFAVFFGVARSEDSVGLEAHAWVSAGRIRVTGGESFGQFAVVGCFASGRPLAAI